VSLVSPSARVVYAALAGDLAVAAAKFGASALSGSTAMLTEAIHSLVDSADQLLLLTGQSRARKPPDRTHPLGYGMETYFWSFVVALFVFFLGGLVAFYQGARHILTPQPIVSPAISLGVLVVSALFEGWSFAVGFREYKRVIRGRDIPLWSFIKASKDPSLYGTLLEDFSAVIGIAIAALGIIASSMLHIGWADGAASIAIGLLLVGVSAVLANETRSLIAGEAVAGPIMEVLHRVLAADSRIVQIDEIATMHLGPQAILMALTLRFRSELSIPALDDAIREITSTLQSVEKRVAYVYVRPGPNGGALAEANPPDIRDIAFRAD
jgi:cation diffusion facilitator family transporter